MEGLFPKEFDGVGILSPAELEAARGNYHVLDLRNQDHHGGDIPDALLVERGGLGQVLDRLSREKLVMFIADRPMVALRAAQRARHAGFARVAVLKDGVHHLHYLHFVNVMRHHAGWTSVVKTEHTNLFRDADGREFQVWANREGELTVRVLKAADPGLQEIMNQAVVQEALSRFGNVRVIAADGPPLPIFWRNELATGLGWRAILGKDPDNFFKDEQGRRFRLYQDMLGRRFHLEIAVGDRGRTSLHIRQILPFARSVEMLYPEDALKVMRDFFDHCQSVDDVFLHYETPGRPQEGGHYPLPTHFIREDIAQPVNLMGGVILTSRILKHLKFKPVEDEYEHPYLSLWSLATGAKRFVAVARRAGEPEVSAVSLLEAHQTERARQSKIKIALLGTTSRASLEAVLDAHRRGFLDASLELVVSNQEHLRGLVESYGIPFHYLPVPAPSEDGASKMAHRRQVFELLKASGVNTLVLARYMQILSNELIEHFGTENIINVHHGLLPSFPGGKPYHQAYGAGVEVIGATAHYVTSELDTGPLIAQEEGRVSPTVTTIERYMEAGAQNEARSLVRAVQLHAQRRLGVVHSLGPNGTKQYVGSLVLDVLNLADRAYSSSLPGELHLIEVGGEETLGGSMKTTDLESAFAEANARDAEGLMRALQGIERVRLTTAFGTIHLFKIVDGRLVKVESTGDRAPPPDRPRPPTQPRLSGPLQRHLAGLASRQGGRDAHRLGAGPAALRITDQGLPPQAGLTVTDQGMEPPSPPAAPPGPRHGLHHRLHFLGGRLLRQARTATLFR